MKKSVIASASIFVLAGSLALAPVVANAAVEQTPAVAASRSFTAVAQRSNDLLTESSSVDVSKDTTWENTESLKVEQVKSPAEIKAEEEAKKAAEEAAAAQAAAEAAARQQVQQQAQAASRSQQRTSQQTSGNSSSQQTQATGNSSSQQATGTSSSGSSSKATTSGSSSSAVSQAATATGDAIVALATQYVGTSYVYGGNTPSGWDCSGFVQWVYSQIGVSLPRTSGAQASVGTPVSSLAEAKPGDILANGVHAAIYIGNGMVVNALNPSQGTQITGVGVFVGGYSIRRVL